ncbi:hypothetical protein EMCRGX_G020067 [Ephydatia muelleri]
MGALRKTLQFNPINEQVRTQESQERAVLDGLNQFDGALTDQDGNGMQVTTLRSLQANRSLRPCEAFKQTGRMQVTTLQSLQANRSYAGSIEDGTCENYFQQPYTQWLRPCEAFKQTGRMQVTTLRSLQANRSS